jgi:hypothetical protein
MTATTKTTLKGYFNTGDVPTEGNFVELIDTAMLSFCPDDYGAVGNGSTIDTAAVMATIAACKAHGGGNIILRRAYAMDSTGSRSFGQYPNNNYSLFVDASNIHIYGPGKLVYNTIPTVSNGSFVCVAFGNGNDVIKNVGIHGVEIDANSLSDANLATMSTSSVGAAILFNNCSDFAIDHNVVRNGWGYNGAIQTISGTEYGRVNGNHVHKAKKAGLWMDGLRYAAISNNRIISTTLTGIMCATNSDISRNPIDIDVHDNLLVGSGNVMMCINGGYRVVVRDNHLYRTTAFAASAGVLLQSQDSASGEWAATDCVIANNVIYRDTAGIGGYAIDLLGTADVSCNRTRIIGNIINNGWSYAYRLGNYVTNSKIVVNDFSGAYVAVELDNSGGTATGNIVTPNY